MNVDWPTDSPEILLRNHGMAITAIPCRFVANKLQDDWDYAICTLGV